MIIWRSVPASQDVLVNMLRKMVMLIDNLETTVILIDIMDNGHTLSCNRLVPKRWCCFFLYILCIYGRKRNIFIFYNRVGGCVTQTKILYFFGTFPLSSWPGGSWPPWWKKAHYFTYISGVLGLPDRKWFLDLVKTRRWTCNPFRLIFNAT